MSADTRPREPDVDERVGGVVLLDPTEHDPAVAAKVAEALRLRKCLAWRGRHDVNFEPRAPRE